MSARTPKYSESLSGVHVPLVKPTPSIHGAFIFVYASDMMFCSISPVVWIKHLSKRQQRQQPRHVGSLRTRSPIHGEKKGSVSRPCLPSC